MTPDVLTPPPTIACVGTNDVAEGLHEFSLFEDCGGATQTTPTQRVSTLHSSLQLSSILPDRLLYEANETITIEFGTSLPGQLLSVDFSPVDSSYTPGSELVSQAPDGTYTVSYTLSSSNTRPSGDYQLPYTFESSVGAQIAEGTVSVRYLPDGPMLTHVSGGSFHADPHPTPPVDGSVTLTSWTDTGVYSTSGNFDPTRPVFSDPEPAAYYHVGQVIQIAFETQGSNPVELASALIWEGDSSGHVKVPLDVSGATCGVGSCSYTADVVLRPKSTMGSGSNPWLSVQLVADGVGSSATNVQAPDVDPPPPNHIVSGTVIYNVYQAKFDCSDDTYPRWPLWCNAILDTENLFSASRMLVSVADGCGNHTKSWIDDEGNFEIPFHTSCPDQEATVWVSAFHEPAPRPIAVFHRVAAASDYDTFDDLYEALTTNSADYTVAHQAIATFILQNEAPLPNGLSIQVELTNDQPTARGLRQSVRFAQAGQKALDHFGQWVAPIQFHHMNVLYDTAETVESTNYSNHIPSKHPSLIHIHPGHGSSQWVIPHEFAHYFQYRFFRGYFLPWNDPDYGVPVIAAGRFSEAMSNVMAGHVLGTNWWYPSNNSTDSAHAENMDYNGNVEEGHNDIATAPEMVFYADLSQAPAPTGSCNNAAWSEDRKKDCMMTQNQYMIQRIFFDMHDGTSGQSSEPVETFYTNPNDAQTAFTVVDFDEFDGSPGLADNYKLMDVMLGYVGESPCNPNYVDRGQIALDVVDVLDGLVCRGHLTPANGSKLLHEVMGYGYTFDPPHPTCSETQLECP